MIKKLLKTISLEKLLDIGEALTSLKKKLGLFPVYGVIIDEIESRNPLAFDNWLADDLPFDELRFFMLEWDSIKKHYSKF